MVIFQFHIYSMADGSTGFLAKLGGRKTIAGCCGNLRLAAGSCGSILVQKYFDGFSVGRDGLPRKPRRHEEDQERVIDHEFRKVHE